MFGRKYAVYTKGQGMRIDYSELHFTFNITSVDLARPQYCDLRIYNITQDTVQNVQNGDLLVIEAGYKETFGEIFKGKILQVRYGRVNNTDIYFDIRAAAAYPTVTAHTNQSYPAGTTMKTVAEMQLEKLAENQDSSINGSTVIPPTPYQRGKVVYGKALDACSVITKSNDIRLSFYNNNIEVYTPENAFVAEVVYLSSTTGLIGRPQVTLEGISARSLINPKLKIGALIKIERNSIDDYLMPAEFARNLRPVPQYDTSGIYRIVQINFTGDNRGQPWYADLLAVNKNMYRAVMGRALAVGLS